MPKALWGSNSRVRSRCTFPSLFPLRDCTLPESTLTCFLEAGAIGGTAQKVGGPFDKDGAVGKQFTTEGSIGGTVQDNLGGQTKKSN